MSLDNGHVNQMYLHSLESPIITISIIVEDQAPNHETRHLMVWLRKVKDFGVGKTKVR